MRPTPDARQDDSTIGRTIMSPTPARLWTVQDVSAYLGVPVMTISHGRRTGYGPRGPRFGRYLRSRPENFRPPGSRTRAGRRADHASAAAADRHLRGYRRVPRGRRRF